MSNLYLTITLEKNMPEGFEILKLPIDKDGSLDESGLSLEEVRILSESNVVYIYMGDSHVYVGQTRDFKDRNNNGHKKDLNKKIGEYLTEVFIFYGLSIKDHCDFIEREFIKLFYADSKDNECFKNPKTYTILNKTRGNKANPDKKHVDLRSKLIPEIWTNHIYPTNRVNFKNIEKLKQSILFKYSPYLSLTTEQEDAVNRVLKESGNHIIEGGAGTGKSLVMIHMVARICKNNKDVRIAVVTKSNWKELATEIFDTYGVSEQVTINSWGPLTEKNKKFDYIIVDEAHRLPRSYGKMLGFEKKYFNKDKNLDALKMLATQTDNLILLYDRYQSIRPSDIPFKTYQSFIEDNDFNRIKLSEQLRIDVNDPNVQYTATDYVKGIEYILQTSSDDSFDKALFNNKDKDSYFKLVDSISELFNYINRQDNLKPGNENRVIAGFCRPWISNIVKDKSNIKYYDWVEKEGEKEWKWNINSKDWFNRPESKYEIGCIHATQGLEMNCVGLIIGKDITFKDGRVQANKDYYFDKYGIPIKAEFVQEEFDDFIKNIYYTLMTRGIDGIRIYIEDEDFRNHFINCTS